MALLKTPLNAVHRSMGAKMVDFGGWDMPVEYSGVIDEHRAVRERVGLVRRQPHGRDRSARPAGARSGAARHCQRRVESSSSAKRNIRRCSMKHGGFVDDILVHKVADDHYFLCVNASNQDKDYEHIVGQ